ncbi:DUF1707 SHOCT-like domain-containing protein [Nocardia sp. NPDC003183]
MQSPAVFGENPPSRRPRRRARAEYPAHTRARSSDRTATIEALDTARADGQLDADEHAAMAELATEARTLGDLSTLVAELHQRPDLGIGFAPGAEADAEPLIPVSALTCVDDACVTFDCA